eukprot:Rmarinus@m.473
MFSHHLFCFTFLLLVLSAVANANPFREHRDIIVGVQYEKFSTTSHTEWFVKKLSGAIDVLSQDIQVVQLSKRAGRATIDVVLPNNDAFDRLDKLVFSYHDCVVDFVGELHDSSSVDSRTSLWPAAVEHCETIFPIPIDYTMGPVVSTLNSASLWKKALVSGDHPPLMASLATGAAGRNTAGSVAGAVSAAADMKTQLEDALSALEDSGHLRHLLELEAADLMTCEDGSGVYGLCEPLVTASGSTFTCLNDAICGIIANTAMGRPDISTCVALFNEMIGNGECEPFLDCYQYEWDGCDCGCDSITQAPACEAGSGYQLCEPLVTQVGTFTCLEDNICALMSGQLGFSASDCLTLFNAMMADDTCQPFLNCTYYAWDALQCLPEDDSEGSLPACSDGSGDYHSCQPFNHGGQSYTCLTDALCQDFDGGYDNCTDYVTQQAGNGVCDPRLACEEYEMDGEDCVPNEVLPECTDGSGYWGYYQLCAPVADAGDATCVNDTMCETLWGANCTVAILEHLGNGECEAEFDCAMYEKDGADCADIPDSQLTALRALYDYTGGDGWVNNDGWRDETSTNPCQWHGVVCNDALTSVVELHLEANGLTLPSADDASTGRRRLFSVKEKVASLHAHRAGRERVRTGLLRAHAMKESFADLDVMGKLGESFHRRMVPPAHERRAELARRRHLLSETVAILPDEFLSGLPDLTILDVGWNTLPGTIPEGISQLTSLEHLGLYELGLQGTVPATIREMATLKTFHVAQASRPCPSNSLGCPENPLGDNVFPLVLIMTISYTFSQLNFLTGSTENVYAPNIENILLGLNLFEDFDSGICELSNLRVLDVRDNDMTGSIPDCFGGLQNLNHLMLPGNQLEGTIPETLCDLSPTNLVSLAIQDNRDLSGTIPSCYGNLQACREVYLASQSASGTIPPSLCSLPDVAAFSLYNQQLEGTIPEECATHLGISALTGLIVFALGANDFTGSLPPAFTDRGSLSLFSVHSNRLEGELFEIDWEEPSQIGFAYNYFTGTIPDSLYSPAVTTLNLANNLLEGSISDAVANMKAIISLSYEGNQIMESTFPAALCELSSLQELDMSGFVGLTGTLPDCFDGFQNLLTLDLVGCSLSGSIPSSFGSMNNLQYALLKDNSLDGIVPTSVADMSALQEFDISYNAFTARSNDILNPLKYCPALTKVDISHNQITADLQTLLFVSPDDSQYWPSLTTFLASYNELSGKLNPAITNPASVRTVDLSYNQISGEVPDSYDQLSYLDVSSNPLGCASTDPTDLELYCTELPPVIYAATNVFIEVGEELDAGGKISCPVLDGISSTGRTVRMDTMYYNNSLCKCPVQTFGDHGFCQSCLDGGRCDGGDTDLCRTQDGDVIPLQFNVALEEPCAVEAPIYVAPGYYPSPTLENPTHLVECYPESLDSTMCNPDGLAEFECKEGYADRLCGRCEGGYYARGRQCLKCPDNDVVVVVFAIIFLFVLVFFYYLVMKQKRFMRLDDAMKSFLFYTQTINLLMSNTVFTWPTNLLIFDKIFSYANFSMSIFSCLNTSSKTSERVDFINGILAMVYATLLSVFYYVFGVLRMKWNGTDNPNDRLLHKYRCYHSALFMLNVLYLPIAVRVLETFSCEYDPGQDKDYMQAFTWVECDPDGDWGGMRTASIILIFLQVIGVPGLFSALIFYYRNHLTDIKVHTMLSFLYEPYKAEFYWYELWTFVRRMLLGFSVTLFGQRSSFTPFFLCCVLGVSALIQAYYRPFKHFLLNMLETMSYIALGFTYVLGLIFTSTIASTSGQGALDFIEIFGMVMNTFVVVVFIVIGLRIVFFPGRTSFLGLKLWGSTISFSMRRRDDAIATALQKRWEAEEKARAMKEDGGKGDASLPRSNNIIGGGMAKTSSHAVVPYVVDAHDSTVYETDGSSSSLRVAERIVEASMVQPEVGETSYEV